jgi:hypothetical protein
MQFKDPAGVYSGGYTSDIIMPRTNRNQRGVAQVTVTTGTVELQGRADSAAPFITFKTYNASGLDEVVLAPYMRVLVSSDSDGVAWLSSTD